MALCHVTVTGRDRRHLQSTDAYVPDDRRDARRLPPAAGEPRRPRFQHGPAPDVAEESPSGAEGARADVRRRRPQPQLPVPLADIGFVVAYREYICAEDEKLAARLGRQMAAAIAQVRGRAYRVKQSVGLYPTAGASDDYVYSRHLTDPSKPKTFAYSFEWGRSQASTPFHPPYQEMRTVMREITAGLIDLCLRADEE